ncbi:VgrG-related protein [Streptomyces sp. NPDC051567]|uniref:VgrG-related protein n=1 Tax=Streptomyces sp. NPDC051567 TaxID=3365660 RepID=UPI00379EDC0F
MVQFSFSNVLKVTIGGTDLTAESEFGPYLVGTHIDQGLGAPAAFELVFRDPSRFLLGKLGISFGTTVVLAPVADGQGAADPLLTGEVTAMEAEYDGTGSYAVVRGYDYGFRLMRQRRVAAYRDQTASDIARDLAVLDGVPLGRVQPTKTVYEFISQANITDWDFLARLADDNEMVMSVDADGRFQFVKAKDASGAPSPRTDGDHSTFVLQAGHDILRLRTAVTAADQVRTVESRGWDVQKKRTLTATATAATNPGFSIGSTPGAAAGEFKKSTLVETGTPYDRQAQVKHAADALADDVTSAFAEVEVVVRGKPKLRPGVPVALSGVGHPFEGKYTVTSVRHVFAESRVYETLVTVSGRQWRSLYGVASGGGAGGAGDRQLSVAPALVTEVQDPLQQGRVKLRFPWLDDTYVSDWTRTVQGGGVRGGGVFPMDVNDEVLVAFDRGALDHAYVIGGLYNGKDRPTKVKEPLHDGLRGRATRRTVSDRAGNRMDLLDQRGRSEGVRLASGDGKLTVHLDRANTRITVDSGGEVTITGSRSVSVEAGTDLSLSARRRLTLKSGGPLTIQGQGVVNITSLTGAVSLRAAAALHMKAGGLASLHSDGLASLTAGGSVQINAAVNVGLRASTYMLMGKGNANGVTLPPPF